MSNFLHYASSPSEAEAEALGLLEAMTFSINRDMKSVNF